MKRKERSTEWVLSEELARANKRLTIMCIASNIVWAVAVLALVCIR